jgi:hypothetical protein
MMMDEEEEEEEEDLNCACVSGRAVFFGMCIDVFKFVRVV